MSKENFVRDKLHVNLVVLHAVIAAGATAAFLTLGFPALIPPGSLFFPLPREDPGLVLTGLVVVNAAAWGAVAGLLARLMPNRRPYDHIGS